MRKQWMIWMACLALSGAAQAFVPQAGTWVVSSELNGKPGRGLAIDMQNDTLVMQMYAYEQNGQPTFYMASAPVAYVPAGPGTVDEQIIVDARLGRYVGGRYLGSGDLSGTESGSPGNVRLRFTSGTDGFITLPGEPEKPIKRYQFGYPAAAESLLGLWSFVSAWENGTVEYDTVELVRVAPGTPSGNGIVVSATGQYTCEQQVVGGDAGRVLCVKMRSGTSGEAVRDYWMSYSVNQGEGDWSNVNDRSIGALYAQRLMTGNGKITGLLRQQPVDATGQASGDDALRAALTAARERKQAGR
ncbi:hypothetical protein GCM10027082_32660 [Comamonas humi]